MNPLVGTGAFRGMPVLVVGGEGFLAMNAIRQLGALGADLSVLVREQRHEPGPFVRRLTVGDMREAAVARAAIRGQRVVLNFAGVTSAVTSNRMPSVSLLEECLPHLSLLAACAEQAEPPLVVFPSSRLVYGRPRYLPVDEEHPTDPLTVYGIHKLTVENYLRVYQRTHGVHHLILRISNPYGPLQFAHRGYGILNTFVRQALAGEAIRLFGDGRQRRDFIFVDDLIAVMLAAIADPACHDQTFNVGGPEAIELREAAQLIVEEAGSGELACEPWPPEYLKVETGDYTGSIDKLARLLPMSGFTPLRHGISATVAAYRSTSPGPIQALPISAQARRQKVAGRGTSNPAARRRDERHSS